MKAPTVQHFADVVDEKLFRFKERMRTNLIIQKINAGSYKFGTKKIHAKVQNDILLIRVGGGY